MKKVVIFIDNGMVQDVIVSSKEAMDFLVVDFDRKTLDQSVIKVLTGPFEDIATLADTYTWDGVYNPRRVKEIFETHQQLHGVGRVTFNEKEA